MANRAGKLVSGEDAVRNAIRQKKAKLAIISTDASDNTKKRFNNSAAYYNVPCILWGEKQLLGKCIGKSERSVIGIVDINFCNNITKLIGHAYSQPYVEEQNAGGESFEQD
jgi:ribosomal protein L7Ae-like RNA K-turn-binding protein